jgi:DNA-binding PadR family transcriptional regulator
MRHGSVPAMTGRQLTPFEHILLGLICLAPSSGYDLKRIFAATPMGLYQPSSGALYPALRRLELRGLVQAQAPASRAGQPARHRRVYEPTQTGQAAHMAWLRTPVEPATVSRDLGLHLMRFVMMEHLLPLEEVLASCKTSRTRSPRSPRNWSSTPSSASPIATRALPSITAWRSTEPASDGPRTRSRHSPLRPRPDPACDPTRRRKSPLA